MKTKPKKTEIAFDAAALVARVEGFAAGQAPARERTVTLPPPVKAMPAKAIRALRIQLGCTQMEFAALLNVPEGHRDLVGERNPQTQRRRAAPARRRQAPPGSLAGGVATGLHRKRRGEHARHPPPRTDARILRSRSNPRAPQGASSPRRRRRAREAVRRQRLCGGWPAPSDILPARGGRPHPFPCRRTARAAHRRS